MNDVEAIKLLSGILLSYLVAKILKKVIRQNRPIKGKTYGMPSSRSTVMSFIILFLVMKYKFTIKTKIFLIIIGIVTLSMKYYLREHSISQLLFGLILGSLIAYLFNKY